MTDDETWPQLPPAFGGPVRAATVRAGAYIGPAVEADHAGRARNSHEFLLPDEPPGPIETRSRVTPPTEPPDDVGNKPLPPRTLRLYGVDDLDDLPEVSWRIEEVIQDGELTWFYGPRGSGKSLVALDVALHIAAGLEWRGRKVRAGHVMLIQLENIFALRERIRAWQHAHPDADLTRFHYTLERVGADVAGDEARITATSDGMPEPPVLVLIDTKQRFTTGMDENSGVDMGRLVALLDRIKDRYGCAVAVVDHSGVAGGRTRGHTSIEASTTAVYEMKKSENVVTMTNVKLNNGPEGMTKQWIIGIAPAGGVYLHPAQRADAEAAEDANAITSIVETVRATPGIRKTALRGTLSGEGKKKVALIAKAVEQGAIVEFPTPNVANSKSYRVPDTPARPPAF